MATPPVLAVEEFLAPIAGDAPSGQSLAYEPVYDELREARRAEDDTHQGAVWQRSVKVAEWDRVIELATDLLKRQTKDLQIAAWLTEALTRTRKFAGLRDGLRLIRGIQETFWESYFPEVEDGDLDSRSGPFLFLNGTLPLVVRSIPLTAGFGEEQYSYIRWQEARATENAGLKSTELMEAMIAEGKITPKQFDDQVAQTPRRFYEELHADLLESLEALKELDQSTDQRFGRDAPSLGNIRKALEECRQALVPILSAKRALEPDPEETAEEPAAPESDAWAAEHAEAPTARRTKAPAARSSGGPIASVADAHQRIVEAAAYLRQNDSASPVGYVVTRALRMGELYAMGSTPDPAQCDAPASEVRQTLRRLASEGDWAGLLEQAEQAVARPEGRAWLDAQRLALRAMEESGDADRSAPSAALRAWLRALLTDYPDLPDGELSDGTPTANSETRTWVREEILAGAGQAAPSYHEPASLESVMDETPAHQDSEEPDVWDQALAAVKQRRVADGLQMIRRAMNTASTGRERFVRKLQLAELCLMVDNHRVALPLSEDLARQVDEFRLEQWEDEQLSARVWAALYRCLRASEGGNGDAERLRQVFTRLCRLDINQAMMYGDEQHRR